MKIAQSIFLCVILTAFLLSCERNKLYDNANKKEFLPALNSGSAIKIITANYSAGGYIYQSTDLGETWQQCGASNAWISVASSSDGKKLAAITQDNIFTSTDGGATWVQQTVDASLHYWSSITSSADGTMLFATDYYVSAIPSTGYLYASTDSGATWAQVPFQGPNRYWGPVRISQDGTRGALTESGLYYTYIMLYDGTSWFNSSSINPLGKQFVSLALSADGMMLALGAINNDYIYTSPDGGATWSQRTGAGSGYWWALASSADGTVLAAANNNNFAAPFGYLYTSADGGATWVQQTGAGQRDWRAVAMSPDGSIIVAGVNGGFIYVSKDGGSTWEEKTGAGSIISNSIVITGN